MAFGICPSIPFYVYAIDLTMDSTSPLISRESQFDLPGSRNYVILSRVEIAAGSEMQTPHYDRLLPAALKLTKTGTELLNNQKEGHADNFQRRATTLYK